MKILLLIGCAMLVISCKKTENVNLVGKWRLVEVYDGYANGGSFSWSKIDPSNSHTLQFSPDNQYNQQQSFGGMLQTCTGTFRRLGLDTIEITSTCQTVIQKIRISELTSSTLILDHQVREGVIRDKYVAVK